MTSEVLLQREGAIATITLNRPEKLNAWTAAMRADLTAILKSLGGDETCRAVVITGAGHAFCAGQDLEETAKTDAEDHEAAEAWIDTFEELYTALVDLDQVTIAAVNGVAAGSGFQLALLTDLRIGDPSVRMGQPEVHSGIPSITGVWAMWGILGRAKTTEFVLTGELVDAVEAQRLGLLTTIGEPGETLAEARDLATRLSALPPGAVRLTKERLRSLERDAMSDAFVAAKDVHRRAYASGEPQQEMTRFLESRRNRSS